MDKEIEVFSVNNLSTQIRKKKILKNVSFKGNTSQIIGLVGANGSGKTTIMKSILGLIKFSGEIEISKINILFNNHPILSRVGSLIEEPGIYPFLTGREHLQCFSTLKGKEAQADINEIIDQLKLTTFIDEKASSYSLGMKQKLAIAIALLNKPILVILDEPMNGLDIQSIHDLRDIIVNKKNQGVTFIISSHLLSELEKVADQLVIIKDGKSILNLPFETFKKKEIFCLITDQKDELFKTLKFNNIPYSKNETIINILLDESDEKQFLNLIKENNIKLKKFIKKDTKDLEDRFLQFIY